MRRLLVLLAVLPAAMLPAARPTASAEGISGLWDATVLTGQVEIPFRFEIEQNGSTVQGFFFDGDRKVGSTSGSFANGALRLEYDFLNTTLDANFADGQLRGSYIDNDPGAGAMEFRARRFVPVTASGGAAPQVAGNWDMYRTAPDNSRLDVSWRLYLRQSGAAVTGAILKTSGDTGTLSGQWSNGKLVLSHFDGDRPVLFEATRNADGTLAITLDRRFTYRAARSAEARAKGIPEPPDPSRFTSVQDPTARFHFSGRDLDGKLVTEADPRFAGNVVILTIGGTWCPNCHDEAPVLEDLYTRFHARGLEVTDLSFELEPDLAAARARVLAFARRYAITYPVLVPGTPDQVGMQLPQLVNFGVYPTTIFIGRDGRVRSVHAGFASVATGAEHTRLTNEMTSLVEQLLAEKPSGTPSAARASAPKGDS